MLAHQQLSNSSKQSIEYIFHPCQYLQIWTRTSPVEVSTPQTSNTSSKLQELGWVSPGPSFRRFPDRWSAFWCRLFFLYIFLLYFCQKIIGPWQCRSMSSYVYAALSCNFYVLSFTQTMSLDRKKFFWWHEQSTKLSPTFSGGWVHEERRHLTQSARHPGYSRRHSGRRFRQEIQHVDWTIWPQSEVFFQDFKPHIIVFLFWCVKVILNVVTRIVVVPLKHSNQTSYSCLQLKIR